MLILLRAWKAGFDSVLAKGTQEPDPSKDTSIKIDGNPVAVPQVRSRTNRVQ